MPFRVFGSQSFMLLMLLWLGAGCENPSAIQASSEATSTEAQRFGVRVCPSGPTLEGVDVSVYQEVIDWDALANSEIKYAIMRTGYGTGTLDTQFERNWAESERVGMIRGVYHFFRANQDVVTQARIMLDRMGPMRPGMLPPTIDIERSDGRLCRGGNRGPSHDLHARECLGPVGRL